MTGFAEAIGLRTEWPMEIKQNDDMAMSGLLGWARSYFTAAELLHFSEKNDRHELYCGPVVQNVGLATELTLKAILRGMGKTSKRVREHGHNTYKAYLDARQCFDEVKFIDLHFLNTAHLSVPDEVRTRLAERGERNIEASWRLYFNHLRLLDSVYDKPYRTRYISPGLATLPDTEIILVGTKILLNAIEERLT